MPFECIMGLIAFNWQPKAYFKKLVMRKLSTAEDAFLDSVKGELFKFLLFSICTPICFQDNSGKTAYKNG